MQQEHFRCFNVDFILLKTIYVHLLLCYFNKDANLYSILSSLDEAVTFVVLRTTDTHIYITREQHYIDNKNISNRSVKGNVAHLRTMTCDDGKYCKPKF